MAFTLFVEDDLIRVIKYLEIQPFTSQGEEFVRAQMVRTETELPGLVPEIQADLDKLDTIDATLTTEQGSVNASLIKADVLEWESGGRRVAGFTAEMSRLKNRIRTLLGIDSPTAGGRSGMGILMRG